MHPPQHIVDQLQALHPYVRLGWWEREMTVDGRKKPVGHFYLIQLLHKRAQTVELNEPWNDRGPVFGKSWDRMKRKAYMMVEIEEAEDVFSGAIVAALKLMLTPQKDRIRKNRKELGSAVDDYVADLGGQMGEYMYWKAKRPDAASNHAATKKDLTESDKAVLRGEAKRDLRNTFAPPGETVH